MILEYHRPETLEEALDLLRRAHPKTVPLGGGTVLGSPYHPPVAVVDLQSLNLDGAKLRGNSLSIGASMALQALVEHPALPPALSPVIIYEASYNLRQIATVAGTLVASDGRSSLTTSFLALDAKLMMLPEEEEEYLGNLLPLRNERLSGRLITAVEIPTNLEIAFQRVGRSPADRPIVCVAVASWPSGRRRVAVGGWGSAPVLAFDGQGAEGIEAAVKDALSNAEDEWASAEYRQHAAVKLVQRAIASP